MNGRRTSPQDGENLGKKVRVIQIRVTDEHKRLFAAQATREGLSLSSWMLRVALASVEK
jgi:uncharacterized protein (DUF1778 family)